MILGKDFIGMGVWRIILNDKNEILLLKRKDNAFWERPGGKIEFGERNESALIREVKEETGVKIEVLKFINFSQIFYENTNSR